MTRTFYIADTHFGHSNIIKYSNRPFESAQEMDETIAANWNAKVTDEDTVYLLGDVAMGGFQLATIRLIQSLKGQKILISGNHDKVFLKEKTFRDSFTSIHDILSITDNHSRVVLCHFPLAEWEGYYRGAYHIFGHIHNAKNDAYYFMRGKERALNAGVDITNFQPMTLEQLIKANEYWRNE